LVRDIRTLGYGGVANARSFDKIAAANDPRACNRIRRRSLRSGLFGQGVAGSIAAICAGRWPKDNNVVFLHAGGAPALFTYRNPFLLE
jgi:hypothetical protein